MYSIINHLPSSSIIHSAKLVRTGKRLKLSGIPRMLSTREIEAVARLCFVLKAGDARVNYSYAITRNYRLHV